jgi:hypothetical protein
MRWRADLATLVRRLLWAAMVVAVAAYGAVVVRNVTEQLMVMTTHAPSQVVAQRPNR